MDNLTNRILRSLQNSTLCPDCGGDCETILDSMKRELAIRRLSEPTAGDTILIEQRGAENFRANALPSSTELGPKSESILGENQMSLNWDVSKVENYKENFPDVGTPDDPQWNPTTMALVWAAIPCAWGWKITEDNYKEVFVRLYMYEHIRGAMRSEQGSDGKAEQVFFTLAEVKNHIGMSVNVSGTTNTKFHSELAKMIRRDAENEMKRQAEQLEPVTV